MRAHLAPVADHLGSAQQPACVFASSALVYHHPHRLSSPSSVSSASEPSLLARIHRQSPLQMIRSRQREVQVTLVGVAVVAAAVILFDICYCEGNLILANFND
jgi:hypothetical protein